MMVSAGQTRRCKTNSLLTWFLVRLARVPGKIENTSISLRGDGGVSEGGLSWSLHTGSVERLGQMSDRKARHGRLATVPSCCAYALAHSSYDVSTEQAVRGGCDGQLRDVERLDRYSHLFSKIHSLTRTFSLHLFFSFSSSTYLHLPSSLPPSLISLSLSLPPSLPPSLSHIFLSRARKRAHSNSCA